MGYFTCYKVINNNKNAVAKQYCPSPKACFSDVFDKGSFSKIILYIPIDYSNGQYNMGINTTWLTKDIYTKYLSILKRLFGGIYSVSEYDIKYKIGTKLNREKSAWIPKYETLRSIVIRINYDKLKGDDKNYTIKYLLTLIRYLYENDQIKYLKDALKAKEKFPRIDFITLILASHFIRKRGNIHSISAGADRALRKFNKDVVLKKELRGTNKIINATLKYKILDNKIALKIKEFLWEII